MSRLHRIRDTRLLQYVLMMTVLMVLVSLGTRYAMLIWQQQHEQQRNTEQQVDFLIDLLNTTLLQGEDIAALQRLLDSYAKQSPSTQLVLFNPTGQVVVLNNLKSTNPQKLQDLPLWQARAVAERELQAQTLTVWQPLYKNYRLYAQQNVAAAPRWVGFWWYAMALPAAISLTYLLFLLWPLLGFFHRLKKIVRQAHQVNQGARVSLTLNANDQPEIKSLTHAVHRLAHQQQRNVDKIKALRQVQADLLDDSPEVLLSIDRRGRLVFLNQSFERVTGQDRQYMLGRSLAQVLIPVDPEQHDRLSKLSLNAQYLRLPVRFAGQEQVFDLWLNPLRDGAGYLNGYSGSLHDISRDQHQLSQVRVACDAAQQQLKDNERMLATMSHELRTPLNGILGMAQLMRETKLDAEQNDYMRTLFNSGQSMLRLLNDILDLSKLEAGKMLTEQIDFDVLELGNEVCDVLAANAAQKNIELIRFTDADCPRFAEGDPYRIRQILLNLIGNAIKFTAAGHVALRVHVVSSQDHAVADLQPNPAEHNQWYCFEVSDTGVGIPQERQADLFQFCAQADRSVSRQFGGTGLGLAISRGLAEAMHGRITLRSTAGKGTTFCLYLPLLVKNPTPVYQRPRGLQLTHAVILEPSALNRAGLQHMLTALDIQTEAYADWSGLQHANQQAQSSQVAPILLIDYALLDHQPLSAYIQAYPRLQYVDCLLLSTQALRSIPAYLYDGFKGFLLKPIRVEHVLAELLRLSGDQPDDFLDAAPVQGDQNQLMQAFFASLPQTQTPTEPNMRVLLAEDNIVNQKVATKMLQKLGCEVTLAENGRQAVELLNMHGKNIDLILMDCRMPEMDGLEATREIRRQMYSLPIVALTANDREEDREACMDAGMDEFLAKPLNRDELTVLINRFRLLR